MSTAVTTTTPRARAKRTNVGIRALREHWRQGPDREDSVASVVLPSFVATRLATQGALQCLQGLPESADKTAAEAGVGAARVRARVRAQGSDMKVLTESTKAATKNSKNYTFCWMPGVPWLLGARKWGHCSSKSVHCAKTAADRRAPIRPSVQ